ncbi:MAG: efflux RND transporter permease subunit, partial [Gammaproteobacteria bacterium]
IYTLGGPDRVVQVLLDAPRMAGAGVTLDALRAALIGHNQVREAGALVADNQEILVRAGDFLSRPEELGGLVVAVRGGLPVYLRDIAEIRPGAAVPERYVWYGTGPALETAPRGEFPAVTVAVGKKPGTNAVRIAAQVRERLEQLHGTFIPEGVEIAITRDYGATANDKARTLITKLGFATALVVLLVLFALGWREALIVGVAVIVTLAITLFASWAWGFTLNRVSLFALIFSIGILVDDAIVVVENIHRHLRMGGRSLAEAIPAAVDEVGGPTILATFTVIAALLPMAFVSGLMGPYMSPIPINASIGMLISLAVAFVVTPWLSLKLIRPHAAPAGGAAHEGVSPGLLAFFERYVGAFLGAAGRPRRRGLAGVLLVLILLSLGLVAAKLVVLKMLPFDNKSEFQIVVDLPEGSALERTAQTLGELGRHLQQVPEVRDYQVYAGTAAPINFNGLVRQYALRTEAYQGDIQVNLVDRHARARKSHEIARAVRAPLQAIGRRFDATVKIVEVPPGPPVLAPLVAEIYGLDYPGQIALARQLRAVFEATPDIVDIDDSIEADAPQLHLHVDRARASQLGISQATVVDAVATALGGSDVTYLHSPGAKYPVPLRLSFPAEDKDSVERLFALRLTGSDGRQVALADLVSVETGRREQAIHHKDLLPVVRVTGDMAGRLDSPLYGMLDLVADLRERGLVAGQPLEQFFVRQPDNPYQYAVKWDGEWQLTYETFRDMGIAYSVGLILIYLLVVAQFRSYGVPLIIMAPIPLTLIGVMPGHALLGAPFTATSMIGMIALAGIIVRNSILLVDFIHHEVRRGLPFEQAVVRAGAVRAKPIVLTGLAAMLGALFILDDPIFSGLAISLIFGILVSTLLTLVVIPVLYYAFFRPAHSVQ